MTTQDAHHRRLARVAGWRGLGCMLSLAVGLATVFHAWQIGLAQSAGLSSGTFAREPACQSLEPAEIGGPMPKDRSVMVLRWLGTSNEEIAYRDQVILFDAYYERAPHTRPIGFRREDVKKANAIFIGHGHSDHMADAPFVAGRTGATVTGGVSMTEQAKRMGLPATQAITVKGGEVQKFNGFTVEAILARHAVLRPEVLPKFQEAFKVADPLTAEEQRQAAEIGARGAGPRILDRPATEEELVKEGTIAYLVTFDDGLKLIYRDSAGPATDEERALMQRIGRADVALVAYQGQFFADRQIAATLPLVKLYNPRVFVPTHHDQIGGTFFDLAVYPLFMAMRDEMPETKRLFALYRTPVCFHTKTGEVSVGP